MSEERGGFGRGRGRGRGRGDRGRGGRGRGGGRSREGEDIRGLYYMDMDDADVMLYVLLVQYDPIF